ncbi:MAG: hypothetical protein ABIS67_05805 [Candidatus Eisenbacteria bacterium]
MEAPRSGSLGTRIARRLRITRAFGIARAFGITRVLAVTRRLRIARALCVTRAPEFGPSWTEGMDATRVGNFRASHIRFLGPAENVIHSSAEVFIVRPAQIPRVSTAQGLRLAPAEKLGHALAAARRCAPAQIAPVLVAPRGFLR